MVRVSVIIPVYNVEKYLEQCLKSVVSQTLNDIEIICVNDGSTDKSLSILEKYANNDSRIKIIDKKNSGYGNTMNVGIKAASGEYIGIVESDDYVEKNMFEFLYKQAANKKIDAVKSDFYEFSTAGQVEKRINTCPSIEDYNRIICPRETKKTFHYAMMNWTGIYRTEFIHTNNILHNETPGASFQDNGFWFQVFTLADKVLFCNKAFYHYRQDNPNSSINSKTKIYCMCDEYKFIYEFLCKNKSYKKEVINEFMVKCYFNYNLTLQRISEEYKIDFLKQAAEDFKLFLNDKDVDFAKLDPWIVNKISAVVDDPVNYYYDEKLFEIDSDKNFLQTKLQEIKDSRELVMGNRIKNSLIRLKLRREK